jgi:hypothetical protein
VASEEEGGQVRDLYFAAAKYVDRSWEYINRSQTHECKNWDCGHAIPFLGKYKLDFWYSVFSDSCNYPLREIFNK